MRKKDIKDLYMENPGFIEGRELMKLNTNSISILPFSEEEIKIDYYPKKKKKNS